MQLKDEAQESAQGDDKERRMLQGWRADHKKAAFRTILKAALRGFLRSLRKCCFEGIHLIGALPGEATIGACLSTKVTVG